MSQSSRARFLEFVQSQDTLNEDQVKACVFMYGETHSVIQQLVNSFGDTNAITVASVSFTVYKLMRLTHRFAEFTGEDKKEVVVYTIMGSFVANEVELDRTSQALLEQVIDLIWWASHTARFAVKKACNKCLGRKTTMGPKDPISVAALPPVAPTPVVVSYPVAPTPLAAPEQVVSEA